MSSDLSLPSAKFIQVYDALPQDAQRALLEKHLLPLLNSTTKSHTTVLSAAKSLQKKFVGIPNLNLKAKKAEIQGLLNEINRDSKRSFVNEKSNKDELVGEVVDSLTGWLSDIWTVVYEFNVDFALAHSCLLFVTDVLEDIADDRGGCKCAYTNQFVTVTIKDRSGKTIKTFNLNGAHKIDQVLLWIWRDLFVSLLASDNQHQKNLIPEMLGEIEHVKDWQALERILYGGKSGIIDDEEEEDEGEENEDDEGDDDDDDDNENENEDDDDDDDDDEENDEWSDEDDEDDDNESCLFVCPCNFHARHWSPSVNNQRLPLRLLVLDQLMTKFRTMPSLLLHNSLMAIATDTDSTATEIQKILSTVATSSSDTFVAAIDIHSVEYNVDAISSLLKSHYHLLRPRDAPVLQTAAAILSKNYAHQLQSLKILEKEMMDTIRCIRAAILPLFMHIDEETHKLEIGRIAKLRNGSSQRHDRVERWVDAIITQTLNIPHPMALAAFMMGLPAVPGLTDSDDTDPFGYLDQADPDLDDLREEYRPKMKERFEGWADVASLMKGGPAMLLKVYSQIVALMPFFTVGDIVDEMIARLSDKPSKHHICDALDAVSSFCNIQKKKIAARRKKTGAAQTATTSASTLQSSSRPAAPNAPPVLSSNRYPPVMGGMEDVD